MDELKVIVGSFAWFVLGFIAMAFLLKGWEGRNEAKAQQELYCEMVELHQGSEDPRVGWPDYLGTYATECGPPL